MAMLKGKDRERLNRQLAKPLPDDEKEMFTWQRKFFYLLVKGFFHVFHPIKIEGRENIPATGRAIVCANHTAFADIPSLIISVWDTKRWLYFVARESLMKNSFFAWLFPWYGVIPVDTKNTDANSIKEIFRHLKLEHLVAIFPQGTRCATKEKLENTAPKTGAVSFALRTKSPLVPIAIDADYRVFHTTRVIVGEPYYIETEKRHLTEAELMALSIELMEKIFALMGKEYPLKDKSLLTGGILAD